MLVWKPGDPPPSPRDFPQKQVTLKITQALNGLDAAAKEIIIETGLGGGDCGYPFQRGVEYVIYAFKRPDGRLGTGICSPTKPVRDAAEDLKYFRDLAGADPTGEIRITVIDPQRDRSGGELKALAGAEVTIEGNDLRKKATSDRNGKYVLSGLTPGEYKVSATLEGYTLMHAVPSVKVNAKGCAEVPVMLQLDRVVTGRILGKDGLPAAGVTIEAVPRRPRNENDLPFPVDSSKTDTNGRYELRGLTTGDYYLGVSLGRTPSIENPYTRWFYPGTEDPAAAILVHVSDRPEKQAYDFALPPRQTPRMIEGKVIWPDGRPVANAQIFLEDPRWPWQVSTVVADTDDLGHFSVKGLDGTKYRIHAVRSANPSTTAEPVTVEPGTNQAKLTLVLTRKGYSPSEQVRKGLDAWRSGQGLH
jgi:hypothetical protein